MKNDLGNFILRSGQVVKLRLIQKQDAALLVDLFHHLSPETRRLRFNLYTEKLPEERIWREAIALSDLNPQQHVAVVATIMDEVGEERAIGVARFARATLQDTEAEVAVVVRDDFQRKGLGRQLLNTLALKARELGIAYFSAWVMSENIRLMKLIKSMELKNVESEIRHGQRKIRVPISGEEPFRSG
jgi:GNAT superfamily N-acetyltransferase